MKRRPGIYLVGWYLRGKYNLIQIPDLEKYVTQLQTGRLQTQRQKKYIRCVFTYCGLSLHTVDKRYPSVKPVSGISADADRIPGLTIIHSKSLTAI